MVERFEDSVGGRSGGRMGVRETLAWAALQSALGIQDAFVLDELRKLTT